jgi:iron complex outermembrane receptor protein
VEAEIVALPVDGLQIDLSGSYLHWEWKCVIPEVVGGGTGPCSSDPAVINLLAPTPIGFIKEQAHAGIQYEFHMNGGSSLTPRFDAAYQGPQNGSNLAAAPGSPSALYGQVSGFTTANLHLTWRNAKKDLEATAEVTNLFNKYYFYSKFDLTGAGAGTITGSPAAPLAWALTMKKSF